MTSAHSPVVDEERRALNDVRDRLRLQFSTVAPDEVDTAVAHAHRKFDGGKIRDFVPLFVERAAREHLAGVPR
nr:hypothetical protein [Rhodococcus sp. (in: high G+C Gram-positive bacteria)]